MLGLYLFKKKIKRYCIHLKRKLKDKHNFIKYASNFLHYYNHRITFMNSNPWPVISSVYLPQALSPFSFLKENCPVWVRDNPWTKNFWKHLADLKYLSTDSSIILNNAEGFIKCLQKKISCAFQSWVKLRIVLEVFEICQDNCRLLSHL